MAGLSIVIPAFNEEPVIAETIAGIRSAFATAQHEIEILVVDDGSADDTAAKAETAGARVLRQPLNLGYGNAILAGVAAARHEWIALCDADGTYPLAQLPALFEHCTERGLDMLVGARQGSVYEGSRMKSLSRKAFRFLSEFTVGRSIPDINSGLRIVRKSLIETFRPVLCGGFSFTTTITLIAMLTGHAVDYEPIEYFARVGKSKVNYLRDTLRAAQILVSTILLFNPVKMFILAAAAALLLGLGAFLLLLLLPGASQAILAGFFANLGALLLLGIGFRCEQQTRLAALERRAPFTRGAGQ